MKVPDLIQLSLFIVWIVAIDLLYWILFIKTPQAYKRPKVPPSSASWPEAETIGNSEDKLFWFIQISDIHISSHGHGRGTENFEEFLQNVLPLVQPYFIVATGDLTDAKEKASFASGQILSEWQTYQNLLQKYGILEKKDFWFDLRGNHDYFDISTWNHKDNHFATYSITKAPKFSHIFRFPFGNYAITVVDGCPPFGPNRPINFFGNFEKAQLVALHNDLGVMKKANIKHVFALSHYPISTMRFQPVVEEDFSFEELSKSFSLYLSGHLHQSPAYFAERMFVKNPSGFLDLEVGDLKDNRKYRIVAVDHDLVSISDQTLDSDPVIIVTNPKDARTHIPAHEDCSIIGRSSHIRVLVFSKAKILSVAATLDHSSERVYAVRASDTSFLWLASWSPNKYSSGTHTISVTVQTSDSLKAITQSFSIDGSGPPITDFKNRLVLNLSNESFVSSIMFTGLFMAISALLAARLIYLRKKSLGSWPVFVQSKLEHIYSPEASPIAWRMLWNTAAQLKLSLILFAADTRAFYPIVLMLMYLPMGPIFFAFPGKTFNLPAVFTTWGIYYDPVGMSFTADMLLQTTFLLFFQAIPAVLWIMIWCYPLLPLYEGTARRYLLDIVHEGEQSERTFDFKVFQFLVFKGSHGADHGQHQNGPHDTRNPMIPSLSVSNSSDTVSSQWVYKSKRIGMYIPILIWQAILILYYKGGLVPFGWFYVIFGFGTVWPFIMINAFLLFPDAARNFIYMKRPVAINGPLNELNGNEDHYD